MKKILLLTLLLFSVNVYAEHMIFNSLEPLDGVIYSYVERWKSDCAKLIKAQKKESGKFRSTIIHRTGYSQPMAKGNILYEVPVGETVELPVLSGHGFAAAGACIVVDLKEMAEKQKLK